MIHSDGTAVPAAAPREATHIHTTDGVGTGPMPDVDGLAVLDDEAWGVVQRLGRALHVREAGLAPTLEAILRTAVELVEPASSAGVNLFVNNRFLPQEVYGGPPNELDALQRRTGRGPCIDASRDQQLVVIDAVADDERWPEFGELAAELGVGSFLCAPLWVDDARLGSVSLYSEKTAPFTGHHVRLAELLATQAALALADAHRTDQLRTMARNRDVIGQAKGVLMERFKITDDAAFELLRETSQRLNRKLLTVAEDLVATGVLGDVTG